MTLDKDAFKVGPIRPPSEANSLLLRVTENCPWNKCKFCMLYKGEKFHTRPVEELKQEIDVIAKYRDIILGNFTGSDFDIDAINKKYDSLPSYDAKMSFQMVLNWIANGKRQAIFLQDANTMVIRPEWLIEIVSYIKQKLPELDRITSYGRADTLAKISLEDYKKLREAGLDRIHSGYESGSDKVLTLISKGATQQEEIVGGKKVKEAGIELSIYFMPGVGGKGLSKENAVETAKVINEVDPDFIRLRTFVLRTGSLMDDLKKQGNYQEATDIDKVREIKEMLTHIDSSKVNGKITSDHIINLLTEVDGYLDKDIPQMISYIDSFLDLDQLEQRRFQLARRMGFSGSWDDLDNMRPGDLKNISDSVNSVSTDEEWEKVLHQFLDRYI